MAVKPIVEKGNAVSEKILKPVFNAGKSIEVENVTVSFKTPKGIYSAVKDISLSIRCLISSTK